MTVVNSNIPTRFRHRTSKTGIRLFSEEKGHMPTPRGEYSAPSHSTPALIPLRECCSVRSSFLRSVSLSWIRGRRMIRRRAGEEGEEETEEADVMAAKCTVEEKGEENKGEEVGEVDGHPYDFHVSGPRNLASPNWRDLIRSTWMDPSYKRMAVACFIQAVYLLELDRQDKRTEENGLAPKWWKPFKYKLTQTLIDERDGSIYGAILEWDRSAALSDFILMRPSGAPRAVLVLRGTLLKSPTIRRDLEDDLRFLAWESLKGSVRFGGAWGALKLLVDRFGSSNVCIGGHSLGAGFALQVGKALAKQGVFVECHLFNPPSVSLAMSLRIIGEKTGLIWNRIRAAMPLSIEVMLDTEEVKNSKPGQRRLFTKAKKWEPHLYVNNSDYICCYYTDRPGVAADVNSVRPKMKDDIGDVEAKLFVMSKGPQKFLEAHGLQQWWSDDMELQLAVHQSKLINRQLRSLHTVPASTIPLKS